MNITEVSNFDANVYLIDINDAVLGGLTGISNKQGVALANRTRWLYDNLTPLLGKLFLSVSNNTPIVLANNASVYARDGASHTVPVVGAADFTTPNDGITRTYRITLTAMLDFTYAASGHFNAQLADFSNNTPGNLVTVAFANCRESYLTYSFTRIVTIGPNKPLIWILTNNATGANMNISAINFSFDQI